MRNLLIKYKDATMKHFKYILLLLPLLYYSCTKNTDESDIVEYKGTKFRKSELENILRTTSNDLNKTYPQVVDKYITLMNTSVWQDKMKYNYILDIDLFKSSEDIESFKNAEGQFIMDDYKTLSAYGVKIEPITSKQQDKGHYQELIALSRALVDGINPVSMDQLFQTSKVSIQLNKM